MSKKRVPTLSVDERVMIARSLNKTDVVVCEAIWALKKLRQECIPMDEVEGELDSVLEHLEDMSRNYEHLSNVIDPRDWSSDE